jgi:maleamate amidohydrolase
MASGAADTYTTVGYSSPSFSAGLRPAVLVVDFQLAFTDPRWPLGGLPLIHAARDRTADLLKLAHEKGVPVAACYTAYGSLADMPFWKVKPVRDEFFYGDPCTAMDPKIHDERNFTYCKNAPSMFFQTPLITFLVKQRVDTVIVTGCTTSGCVRATIVDAFSYGFRVLVPDECCGDAEEGPHQANLADVGRRYADVTTMAEVMKYLQPLSPAATPIHRPAP